MGKLNDKQKLEIVFKYNNTNANHSSLAKEYGLHPSSIRQLLINRGVKMKGYSMSFRKYPLNEFYFDQIDTEDKAYFLGLLYADGYNNEERGEINISLQEEDLQILELFKKKLETNRPLMFLNLSERGNKNQKNNYRLSVNSKHMSRKLSELGCPQAKTYVLRFPNETQVPKHLQKHFIRGYFDGDGSFTVCNPINKGNYNQFSVCIVSTKDFCESLSKIIEKEIKINTYFSKRHKERDNNIKNFHISGNLQVKDFLNWLYGESNFHINRKFQKYIKWCNN